MQTPDKTFRFGGFTFSRARGLWHGKEPVQLRHLERQLLKCLLERPGGIVRVDELTAALWPTTTVSANTLYVHVRRLRIALRDTDQPYRLLKTLPRVGYTLVTTPTRHAASYEPTRALAGDRSRFIRDVTIPDGSIFKPHERFEKIWEIKNVGSKSWRNRYLRRVGACAGPARITSEPLTRIPDTKPGQPCLIRVWLTAPDQPGSCYAAWKMVNADGVELLPRQKPVFVGIDVVERTS